MRVFLIWSGDASRALATLLRGWLPTVLPSVNPWMSEEDIAKGSRQDAEMSEALAKTPFGIVCVTPGVEQKPWVNFEAGGISTTTGARVSPLLLGVTSHQLRPLPLGRFQCTEIDKKLEVERLLRSLNGASETPISDNDLQRNLRNTWPALRDQVNDIRPTLTPAATPEAPSSDDDELHGIAREILVFLADHGECVVYKIFALISGNDVRIQYHLDVLVDAEMVTHWPQTESYELGTIRLT